MPRRNRRIGHGNRWEAERCDTLAQTVRYICAAARATADPHPGDPTQTHTPSDDRPTS